MPVSVEGHDVSQAGAAGSADLGGSSKYSGEVTWSCEVWIRVPCQQ